MPTVAIDARLAWGSQTGDSAYWTGLLEGFRAIGAEANLLLFSNAARPPEIPETFRWIHLPARNGRWWSLFRFPIAARKAGAELIHTQYNLSPLAGRRGILTVHDVSFFVGPEWFPPKDRWLLRRFVPASIRRAARVLTVSQTSREEIERFVPAARGKVRVTYNACGSSIRPIPSEEAREHVRARFGIREPFLLTVGTRWPRKNMRLAIEAAERLPEALPHRLLVSGKPGWGEERLGSRAQALGYVSWEELSALYSAADLYLAPSRHEGFGIPLLEAFRCGCPVLCSAGGALPEVAGEAACVETSWNPSDWAQRIEALLGDSSKLEEMRRMGREREKTFTWEETAARTLEAYREALGR